jgi:hypothetical protein
MAFLPDPGAGGYFPPLLARVHEAAPHAAAEPAILQALLLCMVAGDDRHLLIRTRQDDVGSVARLTASVSE